MSVAAACSAVRWLTRDTFRQARASGIAWLILGVNLICILACLTATFDGDTLDIGFGTLRLSAGANRPHLVRTFEAHLAGWVGDAAGLLLALLWTAGFLPSFLDPGAVTVLLAKPLPRWALLTGKFAGVLVFMAFQALVLVGGVWLALLLRTGVWDPACFWCVPLLLLHFTVFFSFSTLLAVATRSTIACVFGSVAFWLLCWGMNLGRHALLLVKELHDVAPPLGWPVEVGYWLLPKPLDFHLLLLDTVQPETSLGGLLDFHSLASVGAWSPALSVLTSTACGLVLLALAAYEFVMAEY